MKNNYVEYSLQVANYRGINEGWHWIYIPNRLRNYLSVSNSIQPPNDGNPTSAFDHFKEIFKGKLAKISLLYVMR